jgi:hypothetical protein
MAVATPLVRAVVEHVAHEAETVANFESVADVHVNDTPAAAAPVMAVHGWQTPAAVVVAVEKEPAAQVVTHVSAEAETIDVVLVPAA